MSTAPGRLLRLPLLALLTAFAFAAVAFGTETQPTRTGLHQLALWVVVLTAAAGYLVGYRRLLTAADGPAARRVLVLGAVPLWAAALVVPPFDSLDIAGYINNGFLQVGLGVNPYVVPATEVPDWWTHPELKGYWPGTVAAYGPLFTEVAAGVVAVGGPDRYLTFMLFKLLNVVALALSVWLADGACRRAGVNRSVALYLVAWNPLILLHGISNGHNDVLVGLALIALLAAAGSRLWWAVLPALAVGAVVKYATIPLLPLAAVFLVRRHGWARTAASAALAAGLVVASAWPYFADGSALQITRNVGNVTKVLNSVGSIVYVSLEALGKQFPAVVPATAAVAAGLKAAGALAVLGLVAVLVRRRVAAPEYTWTEFVRDAVLVQFVLVVLASSKFFVWYMLMFWPAVGLLPESSRLRRAALAVALAQMGSFTFLARSNVIGPLVMIVLPLVLYRRWERRRAEAAAPPILAFPRPTSRARAA